MGIQESKFLTLDFLFSEFEIEFVHCLCYPSCSRIDHLLQPAYNI